MKTIRLFLFFLAIASGVAAQNTDSLSYHNSHQLSDTSYSVVKANGDSTIFLFEGGNSSGSNYRTMSVNADSTQVIWQGGSQPADTLEVWGTGVASDSDTAGSGGGNYHLPYNGDSTNYLAGDSIYHKLPFTSLTTAGTNTNATLVNGVLNIPNYANNSWNFGGNNTGPTTYQLLGSTNYTPVFISWNVQSGFFGGGNSTAYGYDCYKLDTAQAYGFSDNTALGFRALHSLNKSSTLFNVANTAVGLNALGNATVGSNNTAVGAYAMSSNSISSNNTYKSNTAIGGQALFTLKNGIGNVSIGDSSFLNLASGNYNIGLGTKVAWNQATLSPYPNNFFYISDSTYHFHMKLDSATGPTPNVLGKDGNGNWHVYQLPQKSFSGTATLASGTVTVSTTLVKAGAKIFVSVNTPAGTRGFLSAPTSSIVDGTSFVINSTSATENSTVNWQIINP